MARQSLHGRPRSRGERLLPAVRPNVGLGAWYRRRLESLIDDMARSYRYWLRADWRRNQPAISMAVDATPAAEMEKTIRRLGIQWERRFAAAAPELAAYFATAVHRRSDKVLKKILRKGGISVRFQMTGVMRDALQAEIFENVSLIRSIPAEYHTHVQGLVMRSVQRGGDLGELTKELQKRYGITHRRAALIARDQNNKATSVMVRARQIEVGIEDAVWLHSHGGKVPRRTHLANDGRRYRVAEGWFDPDPKVRRRIWPGQLINCRCVSRPIVKGFS